MKHTFQRVDSNENENNNKMFMLMKEFIFYLRLSALSA